MVAGKAFAGHRYYSPIAFYAFYLVLALSYSLLWSRYPTLGLSSFLVIAAVHFGSDWQHRGTALTRIAYGLTIVTLPALAHPGKVAGIYAALGTSHAQILVHISMVLAVTVLSQAAPVQSYSTNSGPAIFTSSLQLSWGRLCLGRSYFSLATFACCTARVICWRQRGDSASRVCERFISLQLPSCWQRLRLAGPSGLCFLISHTTAQF